MKKRRIIYVLLLMAMAVTDAFIPTYELSALLVIAILCPVVSVAYMMAMKDKVVVSLSCGDTTTIKGEKQKFTITVEDNSILPIPDVVVSLRCKYGNYGVPDVREFKVVGKSMSKSVIDGQLRFNYSGTLSMDVYESYIYDLFKMSRITVRSSQGSKVDIMPPLAQPDYYTLFTNTDNLVETKEYSENRSGDDSSEIFDVREYREGDSINRIHWKISARQEELHVKEFSLPVSRSNCIIVELRNSSDGHDRMCLDGIYALAYAIGNLACLREKKVTLAYHSEAEDTFKQLLITSPDELVGAITQLIGEQTYEGTRSLDDFCVSEIADMSRIMYITSGNPEEAVAALEQFSDADVSVFTVGDEKNAGEVDYVDGISLIGVDYNDIKNGLANVVI